MANEKSFEENIKELEVIVKELESGDVELENAIKKFTIAMELSKNASKKLKAAEKAINKILTDNDKLENFDIEK